jgi:Na+/H+ antiporter NhaD/arsenite permease-like protein
MTAWVVIVFLLTYAGMALGRWPGLAMDRTGIAILAALVLVLSNAIPAERAIEAINFPTLFILFGLMVLSAQVARGGLYDWIASRIADTVASPPRILACVVLATGGLSSVLANDVVVFAMTPMLCAGLMGRGLDPRPFLIGLAGAANAGSAATLIGNPQNILIGQVGGLDFWSFIAVCGVPAFIGLLCVQGVVVMVWRDRWWLPEARTMPSAPALDIAALAKAGLAVIALLALFATSWSHASGVLAVAGALLISRQMSTRSMLALVDWPLLLLFAGLFVVTHALVLTDLPAMAVRHLSDAGLGPQRLSVLLPLSLAGSNGIGNVPLVILLLAAWPELPAGTLQGLALLSTLAGNLLLVGSLANIIVAERARAAGVTLTFRDHARCGVPMTILSMAAAVLWLWAIGAMNL